MRKLGLKGLGIQKDELLHREQLKTVIGGYYDRLCGEIADGYAKKVYEETGSTELAEQEYSDTYRHCEYYMQKRYSKLKIREKCGAFSLILINNINNAYYI